MEVDDHHALPDRFVRKWTARLQVYRYVICHDRLKPRAERELCDHWTALALEQLMHSLVT